jgi:hypothetical protein
MTRSERLAAVLLRRISPNVIAILGIYTVVWGLWVFSPFWTVFPNAPLYGVLNAVASEMVWGGIAVAFGLMVLRGAFKPSLFNLRAGAFAGFMHWLVIGIFYFLGDWTSTGGISSLTFAAFSGLIWLNTKLNPEYYDTID